MWRIAAGMEAQRAQLAQRSPKCNERGECDERKKFNGHDDLNKCGCCSEKLTNVKGFLAAPSWSPDGKTIAVLFTENATRAAGPLVAETPADREKSRMHFLSSGCGG